MLKIKAIATLLMLCCLCSAPVQAKKLTLLYVPLDNRPVCADYVIHTMSATDCKLILPPEKLIANQDSNGNPDALLQWLETKAPKADAAVISLDSAVYGGLVASRTHSYPQATLNQRIKRIGELNQALPIKLYAFSTIMRTPRASKGRVEPPYYSDIGPGIFAYSELLDKDDQKLLKAPDRILKQVLEHNLPKENIEDWLNRREKNYRINEEFIKLARKNKFHYLAIGKDDNAPLSSTHMEARKLALETFELDSQRFQILSGVDQIGLLLLTRAFNEAKGLQPSIYPLYSPGPGQATLPQYSDARLQDSVPQQILAAGASLAKTPEKADLILALNTPDNGIVQDCTGAENQFFANRANKEFIAAIGKRLSLNQQLALADVSYSNGADNGFMHTLSNSIDLGKLQAYNGWNTADNAIGYSLAQGLLATHMAANSKNKLLKERLIDDWFYQSNARKRVATMLNQNHREEQIYALGSQEQQVLEQVTKDCLALAKKYEFTKNLSFSISFPWNRLFEIYPTLKDR